MDMHLRKSRRTRGGDDSDEDDGPPPDPDEPAPAPAPKKEKKPTGEAKEVQVAVRKTGESMQGLQLQGGLTQIRREMLTLMHAEEDEQWDDYEYCGGEVGFCLTLIRVVLNEVGCRRRRQTRLLNLCSRRRTKNLTVQQILRVS